MNGKVERSIGRDHQMVQHEVPEEQRRIGRGSWSFSKIIGTGVGFLAATQGMSVASARPILPTHGLHMPVDGGGSAPAKNSDVPHLPAVFHGWVHENESNANRPVNSVEGTSHKNTRKLLDNHGSTYITNDCKYLLHGTITYNNFFVPDTSKFIDKLIPPGTIKHDSYSNEPYFPGNGHPSVDVTLRIDSSKQGNTVTIKPDQSVVAKTIPNGVDGCNIYHATYGTHHATDGDPLLQIYANT